MIDTRYVSPGFLKPILESKSILKVGVNLKHDYKMFLHHFGIRMHNIWDMMICENVLINNLYPMGAGKYSLSALVLKYLGIDINTKQLSLFEGFESKDTRKLYKDLGFNNLSIELVKYSAADVFLPYHIYLKQLKKIEEDDLLKECEFQSNFTRIVSEMEYNGFKLDRES